VAEADRDGVLRVTVDERPDDVPPAHPTRAPRREYRWSRKSSSFGDDGRSARSCRSITHPARWRTRPLFARPQRAQRFSSSRRWTWSSG
jgi:hypothetical protein